MRIRRGRRRAAGLVFRKTGVLVLALSLTSCGGGGGNAGTCYPASVCGQKGSSATTYAETSRTAGSPVQAEAKDAAPHDADQVRN